MRCDLHEPHPHSNDFRDRTEKPKNPLKIASDVIQQILVANDVC